MSILNELDEIYNEVKDSTGEYENLPLGTYNAVITADTKFVEENSKGNPMVTVVFLVESGDKKDQRHYQHFNLANGEYTEIALTTFARFAKSIGVDTSSGLSATVEGVVNSVGTEVVFELKAGKNPDFPKFKVLEVK